MPILLHRAPENPEKTVAMREEKTAEVITRVQPAADRQADVSALRWMAGCALASAAAALMLLSAFLFRQMEDPLMSGRAALVALAGGICVVAAQRVSPLRPAYPPPRPAGASLPVQPLPIAAGLALFVPLMLVNNDQAAAALALNLSAAFQFGLFAAGTALVAWGLCGAPSLVLPRPAPRRWLPVAALLVLALALRLYALETSLRFFVDEIHLSTGAAYFWGSHHARLLQPIGVLMPFPRLFPWWIAESADVFGRTLTGLRFTSAVLGTLTVGAGYFLARQFFSRSTALAGAILLATFPPFLHFSRLALINIADPLWGMLALAFLARANRSGQRADYALAGVLLGLTQYFYEGGRLLFPALVLVWLAGDTLGSLRLTRSAPYIRRTRPFQASGVVTMAFGALLVALPLLVTTATLAQGVQTRLSDAGLEADFWQRLAATGDTDPLVQQIAHPLLVYTRLPDEALYYGGTTPLVLPVFVPLFLLGIAQVAGRRRWRGAWMLLAWLVLTSLGNSLLDRSTIFARFVVVMPALALLMGVGLSETLRLLLPLPELLGRRGRTAQTALLTVAVAAAALVQTAYYFGPHLAEFNGQLRLTSSAPDGHDALLRVSGFRPETGVHLIAQRLPFTQQYAEQLAGWVADGLDVHLLAPNQVDHAFMLSLSRNVDQAFFIEADERDVLARIQQYFPLEGPFTSAYPVPGGRAMLLYLYTARDGRVQP